MSRKSKLFFSLVSLCFSIAVLCFGVYSALSVSYTVSGSVSYTIQDVFVSWTTRVYRMTSTTPLGTTSTVAEENQANVSAIQALGAGDSVGSGYEQLTGEGYTDSDETYDIENGTVTNSGETYTPSFPVPSLTYGSPTTANQGYAFYIVIDITNYGSEVVNAVVSMNDKSTTSTNTDYRYTKGINIPATTDETYGTGRLVIGLALSDVTVSESGDFGFTISINKGQETFGYDNVLFSTATTAVVESVNVDGASKTYPSPVTFANAEAISLNSETIGAKEEKTVKITLKAQGSSSAYQRLRLTYSNLPEGLRVNSTSIFLPQDGTEKVYTIKFYNQTSEEISLENVQATISLENVSNLLMHDEANNYYYVEMGTVMRDAENEYIRWRYISADGETPIGDATVSSLNGTYILETDLASEYSNEAQIYIQQKVQEGMLDGSISAEEMYIAIYVFMDEYFENYASGAFCAFNTEVTADLDDGNNNTMYKNTEYLSQNILANDYKTSTIRRYMNYTGDNTVYKHPGYVDALKYELGIEEPPTSGQISYSTANTNTQASNMVTDLNIDTTYDEVYTQIQARDLTDLYTDMTDSTTIPSNVTVPNVSVEGLNDTGSDTFWLLSYYEAYTLLSSGISTGIDLGRDWNDAVEKDYYWLRSPNSSNFLSAWHVSDDGNLDNNNESVYRSDFAARPAFQIS